MIFNPVYGSGGGSSPSLGSKTITANGTYLASADNLDGYDEVTANVPNTYAAGDEGKVVSNGALASQSSATYTQNNTYDTTLINSVTVNVSGSSPNLQAKTGLSITTNGSFSYTPDAGYDGLSEVSGTVNVSGGGAPFRYDLGSFFGDTAGASAITQNVTIEAGRAGQKVWLIIMHRDAVTVSGSMTLVNSTKAENYNQWISIYEKTITSSSAETITVTQATAVRMCACTIYIPTGFTLGAPTQQPMDSGASIYQYSLAPSNGIRLVIMNNAYSGNAAIAMQPTQNALPPYSVSSASSNAIRLFVFIASNVNTVVVSQNLSPTADSELYNRLFIYEISAA